jgi:Ca2+-binding RTX toxin-like protein
LVVGYLTGDSVGEDFQGAADWLANKTEVALYQAVELELDNSGNSLDDFRGVFSGVDTSQASVDAAKAALFAEANTVELTTSPDILSGNLFIARPAYTPGGNDLVNTLQDEDELTGIGSGATLRAVLGGTNDGAEDQISPILNNIENLIVEHTDYNGVWSLNLQGADDVLTSIDVARIADAYTEFYIEDISAAVTDISVSNATTQGDLYFSWREDALTSTETLNVVLDKVRLNELMFYEYGDSGEDRGYFYETINIAVEGTTNLDYLYISGNWEEEGDQTINITANADLEINDLEVDGAEAITITANADVVIADDEDAVLTYGGNDGIDNSDLELLTITGDGDVSIDGLDDRETVVDGSAMTGDLTLGTWHLDDEDSSVESGSGDDYIWAYDDIQGSIVTNGGDDTVMGEDDLDDTGSISTGDGDDTVLLDDDLQASDDSQGNGNSSFGEASAASIDTGAGDDTVVVDDIDTATDWNNGDLLDSNEDDTYLRVAGSIMTGDGDDSVEFEEIDEGGVVDTGADNDMVYVELDGGNGDYWWKDDGAIIAGDDKDEREVDLAGDEDFVGAQVLLGSGDDVITFTAENGVGYWGYWSPGHVLVGEDAVLDGGEGHDTLNVNALDSVYVTDPYAAYLEDGNDEDWNAYITGIETANLTILNQQNNYWLDGYNDDNESDGFIGVDVQRFDSALESLNLRSEEAPIETGPYTEEYEAGQEVYFTVANMRDGVELTLSANEATGVDDGELADDSEIDVWLGIDFFDADEDDDSVTLEVSSNSSLPGAEHVDLHIDMYGSSAIADYDSDTDYLIENLTINFNDGGSHFIDLHGFGDWQFDNSDANDGSFMQWRNLEPDVNESLVEYNDIEDKTTFGQGYEVETSLTIANTEAGEEITVVRVTADRIHITGDAAVDLTVGEDYSDFTNNYDIMTGSADDVVDMTLDLVDDEDAIDMGAGDNDRLIISGSNSMGFSYAAQTENDEVWHNKSGIEILEVVAAGDGIQIVLDEEAYDTGIRQIEVTGDTDQGLYVVLGDDFDRADLDIDFQNDGFQELILVSYQDEILTDAVIDLDATDGADYAQVDFFNLIDTTLNITLNENGDTTIGEDGDDVDIYSIYGDIEAIVLKDNSEDDNGEIYMTVYEGWSDDTLIIDASDIADDDEDTGTGGLWLWGEDGDDANLIVTGTANDDSIYLFMTDQDNEVDGGDGDDEIYGGAGDEVFNGEGDDDEIYGNAGDDTIDGGAGDDYIDGGTGQDTLTGGAGEDVFYFDSNLDSSTDPFILGPDAVGIDTITDFDADDDILLFDFDIFFIGNFATATLGLGSLSGSFAAEAFYVESEGILYIDYDGDGNLDWDDMAIAMPDLVGTLTNDDNFFTVV